MSTINSNFIGVIPHQLRRFKNIGELAIEKIVHGEDSPKRVGKIKDLKEGDHIIIYPSSSIWFANYSNLKCKVSLIVDEPKVIHRHYYAMFWLLRLKFYRIFTHFSDLSKRNGNVISLPVANSWVPVNTQYCLKSKESLVSLIASKRIRYKGHKLRHEIAEKFSKNPTIKIDLLGRAYKALKNKKEGLLPYKFSIIVENSQEKDYFTEKLLDCFLCGTIPIYWGAPNIGDYFNLNGMIIFNDLHELIEILSKIKEYDIESKAEIILSNQKIAGFFGNANERIINKLK